MGSPRTADNKPATGVQEQLQLFPPFMTPRKIAVSRRGRTTSKPRIVSSIISWTPDTAPRISARSRMRSLDFIDTDGDLQLFNTDVSTTPWKYLQEDPSPISYVVADKRGVNLDYKISLFIRKSKLNDRLRHVLLLFTGKLGKHGPTLLGDVILMTRDEVLAAAERMQPGCPPEKLVTLLERVLEPLGLRLGMKAPRWVRRPRCGFEDAMWRRADSGPAAVQRSRPTYLRLVTPEL